MGNKPAILILGDLLMAAVALLAGFVIRFGFGGMVTEIQKKPAGSLLLFVAVLMLCSYTLDSYNLSKHRRIKDVLPGIIGAATASFAILSAVYYIYPHLIIGRGLLALSLSMFAVYQLFWHMVFATIYDHPLLSKRILVLGTGPCARKIGDFVHSSDDSFGHTLVGYLETDRVGPPEVPEGLIIGDVDDIVEIALRERVSQIVVAARERRGSPKLQNMLLNCKLQGIEVLDTPTFFEPLTFKLMIEEMDMNWLIYTYGFRRTSFFSAVKRIIDIILAIAFIIFFLPFFPIVALLVKLDSPGPLLYSQTRVGQGGANFTLFKFRTMPHDVEKDTGAVWTQENDPRIGPVGSFLRKTRLDEFPQLYNVLKGDMSFVGPRPERPEFVAELTSQIPFYSKRHFIKPGLTGWAQVEYPYGASVEESYEKLRYDMYYFKNMSPVLDSIIFFRTFKVVLFGRGR